VGHVDGIVLRVCYATDPYNRLKRTSDDHDNFETLETTSHIRYLALLTFIPQVGSSRTSIRKKRGEIS